MSLLNRDYVVGPDSSLWPANPLPGVEMQLLVGGDQSQGAYTLVRYTVNDQIHPHIHDIENESVYVLSGEPTVTIDGREHPLVPGSFIFMPRGVPHSISTGGPWQGLSVSAPGGIFDKIMEEVGELIASGAEFSPEKMAEVQARHGVRVLIDGGRWYGDPAAGS